MRRPHILLLSLVSLVASCGQAPSRESAAESVATTDGEASPASGPGIAPTAAPGVAFNYAYRFRLPPIRIAQVQEEHAQACEKLGIAKCRITGMRYKVLGESEIEAMLAFKLAPEIARQFGKGGVATVEKAEGMVVDTEINGTDVSGAITTARRDADEIAQQIARLEEQASKEGLKTGTRAELVSQIESLRGTKRETDSNRADNEDALASTPMVFTYASGTLIPGFDARSPIREALQTAVSIVIGIVSFLIVAIAFLGPLLLVAAGIVLGVRRFKPVWARWATTTKDD